MSSGLGGLTTKWNAFIVVINASWGRITPLGIPVDPEVYIMMAGSSSEGFTAMAFEVDPKATTSQKLLMATSSLYLKFKYGQWSDFIWWHNN